MTESHPNYPNGTYARLSECERRLTVLETRNVGEQVAVLGSELAGVKDDVRGLKRAFYGLMAAISISAITFAFTVFELLGRH